MYINATTNRQKVSLQPLKIIVFFLSYLCNFTELLKFKDYFLYRTEKANLYSSTSRGMNKAINHYLPVISRRSWHVLLNVPNYDHQKGSSHLTWLSNMSFPLEKVAFLLIAFVRFSLLY